MATDVSKMTDDYIKSLESLGSSPSTAAPTTSGSSSLISAILSAPSPVYTPAPVAAPAPTGGGGGWLSRGMDLLSRPLYGVSNAISSAVASEEAGKGDSNPIGWLANHLTGTAGTQADKASQASANILDTANTGTTPETRAAWDKAHGRGALAEYESSGRDETNLGSSIVRGLSGTQKGLPQDYTQDIKIPDAFDKVLPNLLALGGGAGAVTQAAAQDAGLSQPNDTIARAVMNLGLSIGTDPLTYINPVEGVTALKGALGGAKTAAEEIPVGLDKVLAPSTDSIKGYVSPTEAANVTKPAIGSVDSGSDSSAAVNSILNPKVVDDLQSANLPISAISKTAADAQEAAAASKVGSGIATPPVKDPAWDFSNAPKTDPYANIPDMLSQHLAGIDAFGNPYPQEMLDNLAKSKTIPPVHTDTIKDAAQDTPGRTATAPIQADVTKRVIKTAAQSADEAGLTGQARSDYMHTRVTNQLQNETTAAAADGVYPTIKAGADGKEFNLSYGDILDSVPAVSKVQFPTEPIKNLDTPYHTQIMAGAARAIELSDYQVSAGVKFKSIMNAMQEAPKGADHVVNDQHLIDIAKDMSSYEVGQDLADKASSNKASYQIKDANDVEQITPPSVDVVNKALNDPTVSEGQAAKVVADVSALPKKLGTDVNASDAAITQASAKAADTFVQGGGTSADVASSRAVLRQSADMDKGNVVKARASFQDQAFAIAKEAEKLAAKDSDDFHDATLQTGLARYWSAVMARMNGNFLNTFQEAWRGGRSFAQTLANDYRTMLKVYDKPELQKAVGEAWSSFASNKVSANPEVLQLRADGKFDQVLNRVFDPHQSSLSTIFRNGATVEDLNKHILRAFSDSEQDGKKFLFREDVPIEQAMDDWRTHPVKDVLDYIERMHSATNSIAAKSNTARLFSEQFGSKIKTNIRSAKIVSKADDFVTPYINKNLYYDPEAVAEIGRLEKRLAKATSFRGEKGPIASLVNNLLDPAMAMWKPYVTIIRPGHHIRNGLTDVTSNMLDGVMTLKPYTDSMAMMNSLGMLKDGGAAGLTAIQADKLLEGGDHMLTVTLKGGKKTPLTTLGVAQGAYKQGLYTSFKVEEDIQQARHGKITGFLMDNPIVRSGGHVSEVINHGTKGAHYRALMGRASFTKNYSTLAEAEQAAASRVRRFHPDPMGLSPEETKYMRRIFPFYSFTRQALPLVLENTVARPGRMMILPKTTYALAQATGVAPQSLGDQFPAGELYPSFVTDNMGGAYDLSGLVGGTSRETANFGTAEEGIYGAGGLSGNVGRNVLAMLNPLFKAPIDLSSNTNIGTGAHIADKGEYIDQQIPIVNQATAISGYSLAGSIANLVSGNGDVPDPQRAVQKNEKANFLNQSTTNFLLGLGIQDTTKPSYKVIAAKGANQ